MSIVFDQVSFAYRDPERSEKQRRRERKRAERARRAAADGAEAAGAASATAGPAGTAGATTGPAVASDPASATPSPASPAKPAWGGAADAVWALRDISFSLEDGEFFGIAGHTGSGKSTLIQHMNGLVHPTKGRVLADGQDLSDKKAAQAARGRIGIVFQYPEHQLFAATVYDDVAFGPRNLGLDEDEVDRRVRRALESVHLDFDALRDKSPFELSGGQQRRVAFAGVLAMEPSTLVLDEPVAGLDPHAREEFLNLIAGLHAGGLTVAMVSHSMDDLARLCNRILVLNEGTQFALGTPADVFARADELRAIGLGVPAAQRLANSLRAAGLPLPEGLYGAATLADDLAALYHAQESGREREGRTAREGREARPEQEGRPMPEDCPERASHQEQEGRTAPEAHPTQEGRHA